MLLSWKTLAALNGDRVWKKRPYVISVVSVSCPKMFPALQHIHLWPGAEGQRQVGFKAALVSPDRFLARKILELKGRSVHSRGTMMDIQDCVNSVLPSESCFGKKSLKRGEMSRNAPAIRADAASGVPVHGVRGKDWFFDPLTLHLTCHFAPIWALGLGTWADSRRNERPFEAVWKEV